MPAEGNGKTKILIKTVDQVDFDDHERKMPKVQDTIVVIFPSFQLAVHIASCFVHKDLIPRVGSKEEAIKFPLIRTGPSRNAIEVMDEIVGLQKPPANEETWFLIGNSRFPEFYDYLMNRYPSENPNIEIQDLRPG